VGAVRLLVALAAASLAAACAASGSPSSAPPSPTAAAHHHPLPPGASAGPVTGTVVVAADETLTAPFQLLARQFADAYPASDVKLEFAPSSVLAQRIAAGRAADLFAASGMGAAQKVMTAGFAAGDPRLFARNSLVIAVPAGSPIRGIDGLAGARVAVCRPGTRCGTAAAQLIASAGLNVHPSAQEPDAAAAIALVAAGEADAALVYRTEIPNPPPGLRILDSEDAARNADVYPIIACSTGHNAVGAQAFLGIVTSALGRNVLNKAGFGPP
jgi:molybdate transport system substrate-binding protein